MLIFLSVCKYNIEISSSELKDLLFNEVCTYYFLLATCNIIQVLTNMVMLCGTDICFLRGEMLDSLGTGDV
jgi:hypothetical protein